MGLRQLKAERTRAAIEEAALSLFERQGYDETTMEQIAAAAEVATSTLYRYFGAKVEFLVAPITEFGWELATALKNRPADEIPSQALNATIISSLEQAEEKAELVTRLTALLDKVPIARAYLWDVSEHERQSLAAALATRVGRGETDPGVVLAAGLAGTIVELALRAWGQPPNPAPTTTARTYLALMETEGSPFAVLDKNR